MNGSVRFVYLKHCGNVVSESALKELRAGLKKSGKRRSPSDEPESPAAIEIEPCSICGAPYAPGEAELGYIINPTNPEEIAKLKNDWEATKAAQKAAKKAKKEGNGGKKRKGDTDEAAKEEKRAAKKAALAAAAIPHSATHNGGAPRLPASMIAALEAKKAQMAESAVASLYHKEDPNAKQDWMVRGTFKSRV